MSNPLAALDVTTAAQVHDVSQALSTVTEVAVDLEADSMHHFEARLCFVQLGTDTDIFLLDTLKSEVRVDVLGPVFANPSVTKYFHAAGGDLQFLATAGVRVRGLFDTHRAATLLNWPKVGLGDLVKEKMGVTLQKEHQQADFSLRPLPAELRAYIADDVRYLPAVGRLVREACVAADILEEVLLDCVRMCDEALARPDSEAPSNVKLPRQGLSDKELVLAEHLARELHRKRLGWARAADVPMGRMLSNMAIQGIATRRPGTARELTQVPGVRGPFVREHGDEVLGLLRELSDKSKAGLLETLEQKQTRDPKKRRREEALLAWRKEAAVARKVTPSVVLPNALARDLAERAPGDLESLRAVPYLGEKRLSLYGPQLLECLSRS